MWKIISFVVQPTIPLSRNLASIIVPTYFFRIDDPSIAPLDIKDNHKGSS